MGNTAIDGIDNQELYSRYNALQTHIYDAVEIFISITNFILDFNVCTIISLNNSSVLEQLNPTNNRGLFVVSRNNKSHFFTAST